MNDYGFDIPLTIKRLGDLLPLAQKIDQELEALIPAGRPPVRKRRRYDDTGNVRDIFNGIEADLADKLASVIFDLECAQDEAREEEQKTLREALEELQKREIEMRMRLQALDEQAQSNG